MSCKQICPQTHTHKPRMWLDAARETTVYERLSAPSNEILNPCMKIQPTTNLSSCSGKSVCVWVCFSVYRAGQSLKYLLMLAVPYNGIGFTMSTHACCTPHTLSTAVRLPVTPKGHQGCYLTSLWSIGFIRRCRCPIRRAQMNTVKTLK